MSHIIRRPNRRRCKTCSLRCRSSSYGERVTVGECSGDGDEEDAGATGVLGMMIDKGRLKWWVVICTMAVRQRVHYEYQFRNRGYECLPGSK
jgi:hypothetical protein